MTNEFYSKIKFIQMTCSFLQYFKAKMTNEFSTAKVMDVNVYYHTSSLKRENRFLLILLFYFWYSKVIFHYLSQTLRKTKFFFSSDIRLSIIMVRRKRLPQKFHSSLVKIFSRSTYFHNSTLISCIDRYIYSTTGCKLDTMMIGNHNSLHENVKYLASGLELELHEEKVTLFILWYK